MSQSSLATSDRLHSLIDQGAAKVEKGAQQAVNFSAKSAHHAVKTTAKLTGRARSQYVVAHRQVCEKVSRRPMRVLGIAVGVGALLGWLSARRKAGDEAQDQTTHS